ncbi:hypothetical protein [Marinivivus vitaminiproducens]|uniref:hypothetical protein n=1 Tax=Marinivivus vitaminiproducens TaxID=3035935 RepID=UPI0027A6031B|nr:hypothetical protein P4R82_24660 [Geminicoccaceae bacterium SCSIO 64248]
MKKPIPDNIVDLFLTEQEFSALERRAAPVSPNAWAREVVLRALPGDEPEAPELAARRAEMELLEWSEAIWKQLDALDKGKLKNVAQPELKDKPPLVADPSNRVLGIAAGGMILWLVSIGLPFIGQSITLAQSLASVSVLFSFGAFADWIAASILPRRAWKRQYAGQQHETVEQRVNAGKEQVEKRTEELMGTSGWDEASAYSRAWQEQIFLELMTHSQFISPMERSRALHIARRFVANKVTEIERSVEERLGAQNRSWVKMTFGQGGENKDDDGDNPEGKDDGISR